MAVNHCPIYNQWESTWPKKENQAKLDTSKNVDVCFGIWWSKPQESALYSSSENT